MNVVFWIAVVFALIVLWFALSSMFKPTGDFIMGLFRKTKEDIVDEEDEYLSTEERNDF